jgi:O-antigen/teichoic acid export membrane protein
MVLSGHARWALIVANRQRDVLDAQIAGLVAVAIAGVPLVAWFGTTGAAGAGLVGAMAVWIVSHARAKRLDAAPPRLSLAARPLGAALVVGTIAPFTGTDALVQAIGAVAFYTLAAPIVDPSLVRDLVRLAHARPKSSI